MRGPWLRFFFVLFPAALVGVALACEAVAYGLRGTQPLRNYLDYLVVAAEQDRTSARWLVLGDSTTQNVLRQFKLGPPERVANLTTHGGAGLPSMFLLLRRYLATHEPPRAIILALSPEMFLNLPDETTAGTWLMPVFIRDDEQAWLARFYPSAGPRGWTPAAADLKRRVFHPATGLLALNRDRLQGGTEAPSPDIPVEPPAEPQPYAVRAETERAESPLAFESMARATLTDICRLARARGIEVHVLRAPMPARVRATWVANGSLDWLDREVGTLMARECGAFELADLSAEVRPPNFDSVGAHIVGRGWANQYALALRGYIDRHDGLLGASKQ